MKVFVILSCKAGTTQEHFQPLVDAEDRHAFALYGQDVLREMYSRADGQGAIGVLECPSVEDAKRLMSELPMVKAGLLDVEVFGAAPYRGIAQRAL